MSGCFYGPFISDAQPVNCPVEIYDWENFGIDTGEPPVAYVLRNGAMVDVTGTVEDLGSTQETVDIYTVDCDGVPIDHTTTTEPFHHWRFTLAGALEGETYYVDGEGSGQVLASGTCSTTPLDPMPQCSGMYDWSVCETGSGSGSDSAGGIDTDLGGCNAGGTPGVLLIVAAAMVAARPRRRRAIAL